MIEINLIQQKAPFRLPVIAGMDLNDISFKGCIIVYILFLVGEYGINTYYTEQISNTKLELEKLRKESSKLSRELKGNKEIKAKLESYNKQIEKLKERSAQVQKILDFRKNPGKVLERMGRSAPEDIWINNLSIDENNNIKFDGESTNYKSIGEFITKANEAAYFGSTLNLKDSKTEDKTYDSQQVRVEVFKVEGKVKIFGRF
jgi:hypothetical protein